MRDKRKTGWIELFFIYIVITNVNVNFIYKSHGLPKKINKFEAQQDKTTTYITQKCRLKFINPGTKTELRVRTQ